MEIGERSNATQLSGSGGVARASILAAINLWPVSVRVRERLWERPQNNGLEQTRSAMASASWAEPRPLQLNPVFDERAGAKLREMAMSYAW